MKRRGFIAGLLALPFVAMCSKILPAQQRRIKVTQSVYGRCLPVVMGSPHRGDDKTLAVCQRAKTKGTLTYAYTWKRTDDGPTEFRSFVSSDGLFTFPPECAGQPIWIPALMTDDATQWPKDAPRAIRSTR